MYVKIIKIFLCFLEIFYFSFMFVFVIHWSSFLYMIWRRIKFHFLPMEILVVGTVGWKDYPFLHLITWTILWRINWTCVRESILRIPVLFHWSIPLFLYWFHTILITVTLEYVFVIVIYCYLYFLFVLHPHFCHKAPKTLRIS